MATGSRDSSRSSTSLTEAQRSRLLRWRTSPAVFFREALGVTPWKKQANTPPERSSQEGLLHAVATHRFVACRSGHKVAKSHSGAGIALWWVTTRGRGARCVLTAPSGHQIANIIWPELRELYRTARFPLGGKLYKEPDKGLQFGDKWGIFGIATDKPEKIAGLSGEKLLFIVDEASGYDETLLAAVFGNMAGGGQILLLGNPTQLSGTFHGAFHEKAAIWHGLHISSLDTPNFHGGPRVSGLADPSWLDFARAEYGEGTPSWDVRVCGNFPSVGSNTIVPLTIISLAKGRWENTLGGSHRLQFGCDVARYGDDSTTIVPRRGHKVWAPEIEQKLDAGEIISKLLEVRRRHVISNDERVRLVIDVTGGLGAGPADIIRRDHPNEFEVIDINVSWSADDESQFHDLRSQLWFAATQFINAGGTVPPDSKLEAELSAAKYKLDARGRRQAESKDEMKKRLKRSPDRADGYCLAVYEGGGSDDDTGVIIHGRSRRR